VNVFLVVREDIHLLTSNRFFVWVISKFGIINQRTFSTILAAHSTYLEAQCMIARSTVRQVIDHDAELVRSKEYAPYQPIMKESELLWKDGKTKTIYTVVQEPLLFPNHGHDFKNITVCVECKESPRR